MSASVFVGDSMIFDDPLLNSVQEEGSPYFTDRYSPTEPCMTLVSDTIYERAYENNQHVMYWNGQDCLHWAQSVCCKYGIDVSSVNMSVFANVTGEILTNYTYYDFCSLSCDTSGSIFYQEFKNLLEKRGIAPTTQGLSNVDIVPDPDLQPPEESQLTELFSVLPQVGEELDFVKYLEEFVSSDGDNSVILSDYLHDSHLKTEYEDNYPQRYESPPNYSDPFAVSEPNNCLQEVPSPPMSPDSRCSLSPVPGTSPSFVVGSDVLEKIKTTSRKRVRGPKNWEYLMRLLADKNYNPRVIRWEDENNYTFRIVKPSEVAKTWGQRSKKPSLTYDNFARGLRYHYSTGALKAVSERQLVYKCGPKALKYLQEMNRSSGF